MLLGLRFVPFIRTSYFMNVCSLIFPFFYFSEKRKKEKKKIGKVFKRPSIENEKIEVRVITSFILQEISIGSVNFTYSVSMLIFFSFLSFTSKTE